MTMIGNLTVIKQISYTTIIKFKYSKEYYPLNQYLGIIKNIKLVINYYGQ